jgi:competence transcription factor ComK
MNYITRHEHGVWVDGPDDILMMGLRQCINERCLRYLSTYEGRRDAARLTLERKRLVPILVGPGETLLPIRSMRHPDAVYVRQEAIVAIEERADGCAIRFLDNRTLELAIPASHIHTMMGLAMKLKGNSGLW